jgi:hypothetical protein
MIIKRRISEFLTAVRQGLVTDIPVEYQACESCRESSCDTQKAMTCAERLRGEKQERKRRDQNG